MSATAAGVYLLLALPVALILLAIVLHSYVVWTKPYDNNTRDDQ